MSKYNQNSNLTSTEEVIKDNLTEVKQVETTDTEINSIFSLCKFLSYEDLQKTIAKQQQKDYFQALRDINNNESLSDDDREAKLDQAYRDKNANTLRIMQELPKYILFENYLVKVPEKVVGTKSVTDTSNKNKYPFPFTYGNKIQLENKDHVTSQIYTITEAALIGEDGTICKASQAVRDFMVNTLHCPDAPKGFAGITFPMWKKVS